MKLRNDKEINALFASAHSPTEPTEPTEASGGEEKSVNSVNSVGEPYAARSLCEHL